MRADLSEVLARLGAFISVRETMRGDTVIEADGVALSLADLVAVESALRALRDAPVGWRPIESAPLDGTRVLVADNGSAFIARFWMGYWRVGNLPGDLAFPDGWMPLPEPPEPRP